MRAASATLKRRLRALLDRRLFQLRDSEPGEVFLSQRRVFIVPSRAGLAFAALLLLLFIGAINYQLGLGFALTFFSAACAVVDMVLTAHNLALLHLAPGRAQPVFAGEEARFELHIHNRGKRDRFAIWLDFISAGAPRHVADVAAGASAPLLLSCPSGARGWLAAPRVRLSTRFPLGLFHAWGYWQPDARVLVYPFPEADAPALPLAGAAGEGVGGGTGQDDFAGIRNYQPGDPMRHLAWRQIARLDTTLGGQLVSKHFEGGAPAQLQLDFAALPADLDLETRLSRMTSWVLEAERRALPYALRLGALEFAAALGEAHQGACLRALALHGQARRA
ncbi:MULTISPECIES: DUF58 domain-containing protein [unclassified Janthinobacterium]|uniref:DUF58 domain-containing protein n=1 Tax=unclassified Janthinobacterium TaxID=2610881 RepID=UPI000347152E|nr:MULTISPECIES: DUF58 domain-containing protein [unclassified Janthinobacterium]MEC5163626.1 uncharacterized protein (DUF58 family) [Janthinobacterium sp. CG_S6]